MDFHKFTYLPWNKYVKRPRFKSMKPALFIPWQEVEKIMQEDINLLQHKSVKKMIESQNSTRVVVLGAPGSGKTTFIQLVKDKSNFPDENIATDGISIQNVNKITFWDFGGQEVLFSTHKFFLVERCQYVIVVNLSELIHEDDKIRNNCLKFIDFWMKEIHSFTLDREHSPPVLFLGTHCDLIHSFLNIASKINKATKSLLELAKSNNLHCFPKVFPFYKSSNRSTLKSNISGILKQIKINTKNFIENDLNLSDNINVANSLRFLSFKLEIEAHRGKKLFMSRNEFEKTFFDNLDKENIIKFTKLLKNFGIIETYRFQSSIASEIIFLDPKWLSEIFTSIISIGLHSSSNKRGFFNPDQIEKSFDKNNIPQHFRKEVITIFEMFHLIAVLPSGKYFVPGMLHTPKSTKPFHLGNKKRELIIDQFKAKNIKYKYICRKYEFSPQIPFGFIDKLVVKYLHFPGIAMHESTWTNDFYLFYEDENFSHRFYHILIQLGDTNYDEKNYLNKELIISLYFPDNEEENFYFSFFCHFLFQSPHDIAAASVHSASSIDKIFIFDDTDNLIGEEKDLLFNFKKNLSFKQYFISSDIKIFDSEFHKCKMIKKLESGEFGHEYVGKMSFNLSKNIENDIIFKETKSISFDSLRSLINECMMMKIIENPFTIKLYGICIPSMRLLESRMKIYLSEIDENDSSSSNQCNEEEYLNHQLLMITEEPPWGNLTNCHEIIEESSTKLKLKIAFDIARGINSLYLVSGAKLVHRDVNSENIFIFSLNEKSVSNYDSIHAKLGNFGSVVIASPSCSQTIGNYQYTAPEALGGSFTIPYSKEIDVYSFGILLWEILSGKTPFQELKDKPRDKIETMIIDGYRPQLNCIPNDTPSCIIKIMNECWNSKPNERPSLGKIISILAMVLQDITDEQDIQKYLPSFELNLELQQKLIGKNIQTNCFSNIELKARTSNGFLMICDFHLSGGVHSVGLKMSLPKTNNEFDILPQIHHPNIVPIIGSFQCVPSDEMIHFIDESVKDIYFDDSMKIKCQFYILGKCSKTLETILLSEPKKTEEILKYSIDLSNALIFLSNHNIVHLNLKANNLMISADDELYISDFGLARKMNANNEVPLDDQIREENLLHLSPEVLLAKKESRNLPCALQHSWELGIIIFQMFNKGLLPAIFGESENDFDYTKIPNNFKILLSSLLCSQHKRISIFEARETLLYIQKIHC